MIVPTFCLTIAIFIFLIICIICFFRFLRDDIGFFRQLAMASGNDSAAINNKKLTEDWGKGNQKVDEDIMTSQRNINAIISV